MLTIEIDPVKFPVAEGAKVTSSVALCDELSVAGVVIPLSFSPVPIADTAEIFTDAVPVFVSVIFLLLVVPVVMVPKLRLAGFAPS